MKQAAESKRKGKVAMALTLTTEIRPGYLFLTVSGEWVLADVLAVVPRIKEEADRAALRRILLDARGLGGAVPTWTEKSLVGQEIAALLNGYRLAVVGRAERLDHSAQTVARNRGAKMATRGSEEEALLWLLE